MSILMMGLRRKGVGYPLLILLLLVVLFQSSVALALQSIAPASPAGVTTDVLLPGESFASTAPGVQVSVTSLNLLAPSYHFLNRDDDESMKKLEAKDRAHRVPLAVDLAKQTNADILLLQEVEGRHHEPFLSQCLRSPVGTNDGYDSFVWSALYPNRMEDVVGNAVAWRSDRFRLVSQESFRRGMIVQLQDTEGSTIVVANLHLFAKPSAIDGRLKTMSATIKRIQSLELPQSSSPLDGMVIIAGDFNCEHPSVTTQLATLGYAPHGRIRDRNYTTKITKATAAGMRHPYRFRHIYQQHKEVAPITVSLTGRGPGCMDHMLFVSGRDRILPTGPRQSSAPRLPLTFSKRKSRRQRAAERTYKTKDSSTKSPTIPLQVQSLLATVGQDKEDERWRTIQAGLPNVPMGFPSDHLPIGALFGPDPNFREPETEITNDDHPKGAVDALVRGQHHSNLSPRAFKRRQAQARSTLVLQRHNSVLRIVAEWLLTHGNNNVHSMMRDRPLSAWAHDIVGLRNKRRAPDICCILGGNDDVDNVFCIIEVTVRGNVEAVRREKLQKYRDLVPLLQEQPEELANGVGGGSVIINTVEPVFVLALDEKGRVPDRTLQEIKRLTSIMCRGTTKEEEEAVVASLLGSLSALFSSNPRRV